MKKVLALTAALATMAGLAQAASEILETFDSLTPAADIAGQNGWDQSGAASSPNAGVVLGTLTYTGYDTNAVGNSLFLNDAGQDVGKSFATTLAAADGNTYYYSLLLRHDGTDVGSATGDYLAHFSTGTFGGVTPNTSTGFRGRLFIGQDGVTPTSAKVGIRFGSGDPVVYGTTPIPANTTALIVVRITEVNSPSIPTLTAGNDTAEVFVFVDPTAVPAVPGTPNASTTNTINSSQDIADSGGQIGRIGLRQGNATNAAKVTVDDVRAGTTWADVTSSPFVSSVSDWTVMN